MLRRIRKNENISITLATLELILRKLRDCADGLPVLKSGVSAAITILEMSRVNVPVQNSLCSLLMRHLETQDKQKGMQGTCIACRKDCREHLAPNEELRG